ncbi:hypothetical protein COT72_04625 [archaeon CG10_big_fil_rev_8_21_14_0_10_43_11]|nr:MAG: hypothetical protein COT72_04625 [archaeon CG10_big_fil_rev_8_21_14_0_10_43_11]
MAVLKHPADIKEVVYHTQRPLSRKGETDDSGFARVWVFRPVCETCDMPMNKPSIRGRKKAPYFKCETCGTTLDENDFEAIANIEYVCPYCSHEGAKQEHFIRTKTSKKFTFACDACGKKLEMSKLKK